MSKRFTDTEIWDKEWFMSLNPTSKCLVKYVRDKCNLAGVWSPNWILASTYIGEPVGEDLLLSVDEGKQFVKTDDGKFFCAGFISFQYGNHLNEKSPVHKKIIDLLKRHTINSITLLDTLFNTLPDRVSDTHKEEEEEEDIKIDSKETAIVRGGGESFLKFLQLYGYTEFYEDQLAKKRWEGLTDIERHKIMNHIPFYVEATPEVKFRKRPENYLLNRTWENELVGVKVATMGGAAGKKYVNANSFI